MPSSRRPWASRRSAGTLGNHSPGGAVAMRKHLLGQGRRGRMLRQPQSRQGCARLSGEAGGSPQQNDSPGWPPAEMEALERACQGRLRFRYLRVAWRRREAGDARAPGIHGMLVLLVFCFLLPLQSVAGQVVVLPSPRDVRSATCGEVVVDDCARFGPRHLPPLRLVADIAGRRDLQSPSRERARGGSSGRDFRPAGCRPVGGKARWIIFLYHDAQEARHPRGYVL